MKIVLKVVAVVVALFVALMVIQTIASESGEVVVVSTYAADGSASETRLWVVDHDESMWLRSGSPLAGWYQRMVANDRVSVEREGRSQMMQAIPLVGERAAINALMLEKYGWADQFIGLMFGRDDAIAIRLAPLDAE